jgi:hypothetical protein
MLKCGRFRLLLDTIEEGVLVTVMDEQAGFICTIEERDTKSAVLAALDLAQLHDQSSDARSDSIKR